MRAEQYTAEALALWIVREVASQHDFSREGLPGLDVEHLFTALARFDQFPQGDFSIAVAGFDLSSDDLHELADRSGLGELGAVSDDLHVAAAWRNDRARHPRCIVLGSGYHAGVHTLGHYARPESEDLALVLLRAIANRKRGDVQVPDVHALLLERIADTPGLAALRSLEVCAAFLSMWDGLAGKWGNAAPGYALLALGLLCDSEVFEFTDIGARLETNLNVVAKLRETRLSSLGKRRRRIEKYGDPDQRHRLLVALGAVRRYIVDPGDSADLELSQAMDIISLPESVEVKPDVDPGSGKEEEEERGSGSVATVSAQALLDGNEADLDAISTAIEEAWKEFDIAGKDPLQVHSVLPSQEEISDNIRIDREVLDWIDAFCGPDVFGGLVETKERKLRTALKQAADGTPLVVRVDQAVNLDGEWFSVDELLQGWDEDLGNSRPSLRSIWRDFRRTREELLPHIHKLLYHAREWLDGRPDFLQKIRHYLQLASQLYGGVQSNYRSMSEQSPDWAMLTVELLLCLDVVQVRVQLPDGEETARAVLLPTHPLHLWRNERLSSLLRGLATTIELEGSDRSVILRHLAEHEQFLSIIRLGSLPGGRGLRQLLPVVNRVEDLPVFENLVHACSSLDGANVLCEAIEQYVMLHPNDPYPLRLAIVNPPTPEALLARLIKILDDQRRVSARNIASIYIDVYATGKHSDRIDALRGFQDSQYEDVVQAKVSTGRVVLNICSKPERSEGLDGVVERISRRPVHIVAIFDESSIHIRRRGAGQLLPMSPFCLRHDVVLDRRTAGIELRPQPGESPFSEFLLLMSELEGTQRDTTPYAHADAKALADIADRLMQGDDFAARWVFLADRALPTESGMHSVKIWDRREGQRETFLAARDFLTLGRLLRPVFAERNLTLTPESMARILHSGARLLGSGLLSIFKKRDGLPDRNSVVGFAGLMIAAWDIWDRYPDALVLSVDHPIARLWLRSGSQFAQDRCDLIALRKDGQRFVLTAIEVKSSLAHELKDGVQRNQRAERQVLATLSAVRDGLSAARRSPHSPLSIPRCEMLKLVLVHAARARTGMPGDDRERRRRWGRWLVDLFGEKATHRGAVGFEGRVVSVLFLRSRHGSEKRRQGSDGDLLVDVTIAGPDIARLLGIEDSERKKDEKSVGERRENTNQAQRRESPLGARSTIATRGNERIRTLEEPGDLDKVGEASTGTGSGTSEWPPTVNAFGLIGQNEAVDRLMEQASYARDTGRRFGDKLLVGPAGVGKSTLVRKIAQMLIGQDCVFFNGSSLRKPSDIVDRLLQEELIPSAQESGQRVIDSAVIFIDEVHGIAASVATALLSALDDERIATIERSVYDFRNVIFLLATTDQGRLSEAFQSRPNKTWLRPYTLHEVAGIVWLHSREELQGRELTREACYEIAARTQCNPRRAVRDVTQVLIPHFYSRGPGEGDDRSRLSELATVMTANNIGEFYEEQGVDANGLDHIAQRLMSYLKRHSAASEATLRRALAIPHRNDFVEVTEYLLRLGLVEPSQAGRRLTRDGASYLREAEKPDLRSRISRALV